MKKVNLKWNRAETRLPAKEGPVWVMGTTGEGNSTVMTTWYDPQTGFSCAHRNRGFYLNVTLWREKE